MSALNSAAIDNAARGNVEEMRSVLNAITAQLAVHDNALGTSTLAPVSGVAQAAATQPPKPATLSVTGANGNYLVSISNPASTLNRTIYHEVSYSPEAGFTGAVALEPTSATMFNYPAPGTNLFWRIRSSYDRAHWNAYTVAASNAAVAASLQSSAATANNVPLNQTNYATIDSQDNGTGSANARIFGSGGPGFMYVAVKGGEERTLPSATVVNIPFSTNPVIAYGDKGYVVKSTLSQVFRDDLIPTGSVSIVGAGGVTLPTLSLVLDANGHIVGWNVLTQGNGLTGPVALSIASAGGGHGATPGTQTITGGKLVSVAPGNPGVGYNSADTVAATGGTFGGYAGGGGNLGGNGGRFIYNDGTLL